MAGWLQPIKREMGERAEKYVTANRERFQKY
jgi:hypothetical protein